MSKKAQLSVVVAIFLSWMGIPLKAGLIISPVNKPSDLDLSGNVKYAINFGNNGNPNIGGFIFSQDQQFPQISLSASGEMVIPSWFGLYPNSGDANLDMLLGGVAWTNNGPGTCITYINVAGMKIGTPYDLQLILYEPQQISTRRLDIIVENEMIVKDLYVLAQQGGIAGKGGSVVKYDFISKDKVLNISVTAIPNDGNHASGISGFVLTEIPEPATLSLIALGAGVLLKRRS